MSVYKILKTAVIFTASTAFVSSHRYTTWPLWLLQKRKFFFSVDRNLSHLIIYRVRYMLSSYVCLCVSVTLQYCIKTAKRKITQKEPHDITETLVFFVKDHSEIRTGSSPTGAKRRFGRLNLATFDE